MKKPPNYNIHDPAYVPEKLIAALREELVVSNDFKLALVLGIDHATISRVRSRIVHLSDTTLLRIVDVTGWTPARIRELAGIPAFKPSEVNK